MKDLIKGHTYLIRSVSSRLKLSSITILLATNTAFYVRWNNGLESTDTWEFTTRFQEEYCFVEDITYFMFETQTQTQTYATKPCSNCNETGIVLDYTSSSNTKVCPHCWGTKRVSA